MPQKAAQIETPILKLKWCSVEEHCNSLRQIKSLSFWWYLGQHKVLGNFSVPFQDDNQNWWYQVKPGVCWPVNFLQPMDSDKNNRPLLTRSFLGYQNLVADEKQANSHLVINVINNLCDYGESSIDSKRRNAVRKGLKCCRVEAILAPDEKTFDECRATWDSLSTRTGWKQTADKATFDQAWALLVDCPGVTILVARDVETNEVCGFLIVKIIGDTAYVDTLASRTEKLSTNVNDALMYSFLINAAKIPGVKKAHFAIKSYVKHLESFKRAMGFVPFPFPARTELRPGIGFAMKRCFPKHFKRMMGQFDEVSPEETVEITPRISEQIKERIIAAIAKSYQPCPLIGPKWFQTPQTGHVGFEFVGAGKLAKAVHRTKQEVCRDIMANFDVVKFPAALVLKNGPTIQVIPQEPKTSKPQQPVTVTPPPVSTNVTQASMANPPAASN